MVKLVSREPSIFIILKYRDFKNIEKKEYIYSKLDKSLKAIDWDSPVVVTGDLNGHVGFLGK